MKAIILALALSGCAFGPPVGGYYSCVNDRQHITLVTHSDTFEVRDGQLSFKAMDGTRYDFSWLRRHGYFCGLLEAGDKK